jgi:hypothetical protein
LPEPTRPRASSTGNSTSRPPTTAESTAPARKGPPSRCRGNSRSCSTTTGLS